MAQAFRAAGTDQQQPGYLPFAYKPAGVFGPRDLGSIPNSYMQHPSDLGQFHFSDQHVPSPSTEMTPLNVSGHFQVPVTYSTLRSLNQEENLSAGEIKKWEIMSW